MDRRQFFQQCIGAAALAAVLPAAKAGIPEKKTGDVNVDYPLYWLSEGALCRLVKVEGNARKGDLCGWTGRPNEVGPFTGRWPIAGALYTDPSNGWAWLCFSGGPAPVRAL
jgi:hypothetical protein